MNLKIIFVLIFGYLAIDPSLGYVMCPAPPQKPTPGCCPPPGAPPPPPGAPLPASDCPRPPSASLPPTTTTTTAATKSPSTTSTTLTPATTTTVSKNPVTTTTTTTSSTGGTSAFATKVKTLIDAGTCNSVSTLTICGTNSDSYSYYETFTYKTYRVIIISGIPSHKSEYGQSQPNPNLRCVRYQYVALPLSPTKSSSDPQATPMGPTAFFNSGAVMYNPLSSPQGNLALDKEWVSLDPCHGHSSPDKQYHYHAVAELCLPGSSSPTKRALLGYALDGFPVYGFSQNSAGQTLKSCWKTTLASPTMITDFTYDAAGFSAGTCHLDKANGYTFSAGYGYVTTAEPYYVPYKYAGSSWARICGFSP